MILFSLITLNYTHIAYIIIEFNYFEKRKREREIQEFWRIEEDWEGEFWEVGITTHVGKGNLKKWEQKIFKENFEDFEKGEGRSQKIFF